MFSRILSKAKIEGKSSKITPQQEETPVTKTKRIRNVLKAAVAADDEYDEGVCKKKSKDSCSKNPTKSPQEKTKNRRVRVSHRRSSTVCGIFHSMYLIPTRKLIELYDAEASFKKKVRMHSHQYLRDKGCLVLWDDIPENSHIIFVSHEWLSYNHPDPEGVQLETLVSTLRRLKSGQIPNVQTLPFERLIYHENFSTSAREWQSILEHSFLWVDWMSMPQPSAEANKESESYWECVRDGKRAIHSIPAYMERSDFMLVLCPQAHHSDRKEMADDMKTISTCYRTWRRRGWCVLEMFACILSRWKEYPILLVESSNGTPAWLPFRETVKFLIGRCDFSCCQLNHRLHTATQLNQNVDGKRGDVIQCDKPVVLKIFKDLLRTKVDFLFTKGDISRARMYASFGAHHWLQGLPNAEAATSNSRAKFSSGAARQAHVDALKVSLRWDVRNDGERFDAYGISVLQYAIIRNDIRAVREILEQLEATASQSERYDHLNCAMDENVEFGIIEKSPTLNVAVAFSSTNIVASLIEAGADPYAGDVHGNQVTQAMAFMSRVDMVRWWHCRFPEWDWNEASRNRTVGGVPLLSAAFEGMQSYETAMEIIKAGADPTMQTYDGGGMLICACSNSDTSVELVKYILSSMSPTEVNRISKPITWKFRIIASFSALLFRWRLLRDTPLVSVLATSFHNTALHCAVRRGDLRVVNLLLDNGASPTIVNGMGMNAFEACERHGPFPGVREALSRAAGGGGKIMGVASPGEHTTFGP